MYPFNSYPITYFTLVLINLSLLFACKPPLPALNAKSIETTAEKELGTGFTIDFNESKTYVLCQQARANDHINSAFKYIVIKVSESAIVQKGSFQAGYVKWVSNESIELASSDKFSSSLTKQEIKITSNEQ